MGSGSGKPPDSDGGKTWSTAGHGSGHGSGPRFRPRLMKGNAGVSTRNLRIDQRCESRFLSPPENVGAAHLARRESRATPHSLGSAFDGGRIGRGSARM
jgi:hypothetical protein